MSSSSVCVHVPMCLDLCSALRAQIGSITGNLAHEALVACTRHIAGMNSVKLFPSQSFIMMVKACGSVKLMLFPKPEGRYAPKP